MKPVFRTSLILAVALALAVLGALAFGGVLRPHTATGADEPGLVGTWHVIIPGAGDTPGFEALQTFHADGTFTETSNLLGQGEEGPAHGVWNQDGDHYNLTFQLFAFDGESGEGVGMIQVSLKITLASADTWVAQSGPVHFIAPDGTLELLDDGSASPPITATRLQVQPVP